MEKCPVDFYQLVFTTKFDNSSPSVTRVEEICHVIMR